MGKVSFRDGWRLWSRSRHGAAAADERNKTGARNRRFSQRDLSPKEACRQWQASTKLALVRRRKTAVKHREMGAVLVEILDPLKHHRIVARPDDELPLQAVAAREMPADFIGR